MYLNYVTCYSQVYELSKCDLLSNGVSPPANFVRWSNTLENLSHTTFACEIKCTLWVCWKFRWCYNGVGICNTSIQIDASDWSDLGICGLKLDFPVRHVTSCCSKMETIWECVIHCTECPDSPKLLTANQLKTINNRAEQYINQSIQPYGELASVYRRKYQTSNLTSTPTTSFYCYYWQWASISSSSLPMLHQVHSLKKLKGKEDTSRGDCWFTIWRSRRGELPI